MSLRKFLIIGAALLSLFLVGAIFFSIRFVSSRVYQDSAIASASRTAARTAHTLNQVMRKGWTRPELEEFLLSLTDDQGAGEHVLIYRGDQVSRQYGPVEQAPMSDDVRQVFAGGGKRTISHDSGLTLLAPVRAATECFGCHQGIERGQVLGVIEVRRDVRQETAVFNRWMLLTIVPIAVFPILGAVMLALLLHRRIFSSINSFHREVRDLATVSDLVTVKTSPPDFPLDEFNILKQETNLLIDKIRQIAVDRETLEFEIHLMEKLLITSEVVRDWHAHVKSMLIELNKVMEISFLFAMFCVESQVYELEVFWLRQPPAGVRARFEEKIAALVRQTFPGMDACATGHHVAITLGRLEGVTEEDVDIHTKELFLDAPKIGGIVGIGLLARTPLDHLKQLVVEGILITLLNVIGSVKAIYKYTQEVEFYSSRDAQTGLYNQRFFRDLLHQEIARSGRQQHRFSMLLIDLDNFKAINDSHGHAFGDSFLQTVAGRLQAMERSGDILARFGGDEFAFLLLDTGEEQAVAVAERVVDSIGRARQQAPDKSHAAATATVSVVSFPTHGTTAVDLLLMAEKLLEKGKHTGKNRFILPDEADLIALYREKSEKAQLLQRALDENLIVPAFQPIVDCRRNAVSGHEALMRIKGNDGELIAASEFIEIAEDMGIINRMDLALLEKVFERVNVEGYRGSIFCNLSPRDLVHGEFMASVDRLRDAYNIDPATIVFEITEREAVRNLAMVEKFVLDLKMKGFRFALDDFGSGFSSYFYLKKFPIDYIKIEGDFVRGMLDNDVDMAVVESIDVLGKRLGVKVIAECVETAQLCQAACELGIDFVQGFHISHPGPGFMERLPGGCFGGVAGVEPKREK